VKNLLQDKVVIVTGASSGIGLASARQFGSEGAKVVMAARSYERMLELAPSVAPVGAGALRPVRRDPGG
jgi:Short-chain alcohol dehydrogenase of unknown specificity